MEISDVLQVNKRNYYEDSKSKPSNLKSLSLKPNRVTVMWDLQKHGEILSTQQASWNC